MSEDTKTLLEDLFRVLAKGSRENYKIAFVALNILKIANKETNILPV